MAAYTPTNWVNYGPPPMSAANLNKLTDELESQASAAGLSHTLPTWADGAAPALTDATPWNEMERVCQLVASQYGLPYTTTVWQNGWTPGRNQTNLNKLELQAASNRAAIDAGGSPTFGALLPARLAESTGSAINVSTLSALTNAISTAANGSIINITSTIDAAGATISITRDASAANPITIQGGKIINHTRISISGASYIRLRSIELTGFTGDGIKIDGGSTDIEIDHCYIHDGYRQGILAGSTSTGGAVTNIQIWNNEIGRCGNTANGTLDHGIYFNTVRGNCVIANNLFYDPPAGYNCQIYPDAPNVIFTCNTMDGGDVRGGAVISAVSGTDLTRNTITVGAVGTNAAWYCINASHPGPGNVAYDSLGFGNGLGDFASDPGMTYTNCTHGDPLYVSRSTENYHLSSTSPAKNKIQPARYGYVPALDRDGNPRITADAGCYRVG